jgi:N6-adenosine-specific RNA methylase IME4
MYQLIYADPPWHFRVHSEKGEGRSAIQHYSVMSLEDIENMPIKEISEDNSVCLMWVIDPMIEQGYQVMRAWGFTPKTVGFYWVKQNIKSEGFFTGLGYYTRANPEQCILGTRGKGLPRKDKGVKRLIVAPRGRHSAKPIEAYERIERLFGNVSRVELFARNSRQGWSAFGNQVEGSIHLPTLPAPDARESAASTSIFPALNLSALGGES